MPCPNFPVNPIPIPEYVAEDIRNNYFYCTIHMTFSNIVKIYIKLSEHKFCSFIVNYSFSSSMKNILK